MLNRIKNFLRDEKGAETLEYIAIASIIIILGALAYSAGGIGSIISQGFTAISGAITDAQSAG